MHINLLLAFITVKIRPL